MLYIVDTTDGRGLNVIIDGKFAALFPAKQRDQVEWLVEQTNRLIASIKPQNHDEPIIPRGACFY